MLRFYAKYMFVQPDIQFSLLLPYTSGRGWRAQTSTHLITLAPDRRNTSFDTPRVVLTPGSHAVLTQRTHEPNVVRLTCHHTHHTQKNHGVTGHRLCFIRVASWSFSRQGRGRPLAQEPPGVAAHGPATPTPTTIASQEQSEQCNAA